MEQPNYLDYCTDDIEELYAKLQDSVLKTVVKRIIKYGEITPSAWHDIKILQESGVVYDDVLDIISQFTQLSQSAVQEMFETAKVESIKYDNEIYKAAGMKPLKENGSPAVNQIVKGAISKTNGNLKNLTMTTAGAAQDKFIDACSIAEMEINTGAYDVNTAIRHAVEYAIQDGANVYFYNDEEDGTIVTAKRNIVSAVRTAVLTGVSQTTGEISLENAKKMGTDLMELSAHTGARPSHSVWQGKIVCFSRRKTKYLTLADIGYGEIDGFKGINCRHYWFPFIEGVSTRTYTDEQLEEMNNATVNFNGNEIPLYKATQKQRAMERQIRFERSQLVSLNESIEIAKSLGNNELANDLQINFDNQAVKLKRHEAMYKDYCNQTGLPVLSERLQYPAFNRSVSQKAYNAANRNYKEWSKSIGAEGFADSLSGYYKKKYGNPRAYEFLQGYNKCIKTGEISPLVSLDYFMEMEYNISRQLYGVKTIDGFTINDCTPHFVGRVIGQVKDSHSGMRQGTPIADIVEALTNGTVTKIRKGVPTKNRNGEFLDERHTYTGNKAKVTISVTEGKLIQANPR